MLTRAFLQLVWPSTGPYLTAIPIKWKDKNTGEEKKGFRHFTFDDVDDAAQWCEATAHDHDEPHNVFFALGNFKSVELNDRGGVATGARAKANVAALRAFWLDIDIKPDPKHYATRAEAGDALKAFVKAFSLPKPYVVSSGGGLHVYWPLTEDVPITAWEPAAQRLKAMCKSWGLRADPSRTADCASVLRPVGTVNLKTGYARPVELLMEGTINSYDAVTSRFLDTPGQTAQKAPQALKGTAPVLATDAQEINAEGAAGAEQYAPANGLKVVEKCQQLRWQKENPDQVSEPSWYDMIGCLRHTVDGADLVHELSSTYPGYSELETQIKVDNHTAGGFGPTLCETFESHNPGGCQGCPFAGKIKSPIQLGREYEPAETPVIHISTPEGVVTELELPEPPWPYKRAMNKETGVAQIVMSVEDPVSELVEDVVIYDYDLYPSRMTYDEREARYIATLTRWLPKEGWGDVDMGLGELYDKKKLAINLGNFGILPDLTRVEALVQYMIGYIRNLNKQIAATVVYAQLGWREDGRFILADRAITRDGEQPITVSKNMVNALSWQEPKGDLATWKKCVSIYERPGLEPLQFGFLVGFASPLFQMTNFGGMMVSMWGERGCGKSSALMCASSIWGHKKFNWVDMEHDTHRAFYAKLGVLKNLPACYDEVTNLHPEKCSELAYAISKGQGRQRLNGDATLQQNHGNWSLMQLLTSNASLHNKLAQQKSDASAEASRIFEFYVPPKTLSKQEADANFDLLNDHYGLAGPIFASALVRNTPLIKSRISHWQAEVDKLGNIASSERFWSACIATVLTAAEVANKCGLTNVDIDRLLTWAVGQIDVQRGVVQENVRTSSHIISDYLAANLRNMLVINSMEKGRPPVIGRDPTNELRVRFEVWHNTIYIDRAHFRRFCNQMEADPSQTLKELMEAGAIRRGDARVCLGKGTNYKTGQVWAIVLNMNHEMLGDVHDVVRAKTAEIGQAMPASYSD